MQELKIIQDLIHALQCIPGIGAKSAERIAYDFLKMNQENVQELISSLDNLKNISICPTCFCYMENDTCPVCSDSLRDQETLIVTTYYKDVLAFERLSSIKAKYHVLNGSISPTKGILASAINIDKLIKRIEEENIKEVILATSPTLDGETTALYITKLLEKFDVKVTRLAYGLPLGASLDYTDDLTLTRALENRTNYKK